jgi:hypothetical protein
MNTDQRQSKTELSFDPCSSVADFWCVTSQLLSHFTGHSGRGQRILAVAVPVEGERGQAEADEGQEQKDGGRSGEKR